MDERFTRRAALRAGAVTAGLFAVGGVAGACGSGDKTGATSVAAGGGGTQSAPISYWSHDELLSKPVLEHWIEVLNAEPDPPYRYSLDTTIIPANEIPKKARLAFLADSNAPDMLNIVGNEFSQIMSIASDTLVDLTDAVDAVKDENLENLWRPYSYEDRVYGVELSTTWVCYYYRESEFKKLGLPTEFGTWDELIEAGEKIAVPKGKALGLVETGPLAASSYVPYLLQAGGQVFNPDGSVALNSQEAVDALEFLVRAVQTDVFLPVTSQISGPGVVALKTGEAIGLASAQWFNEFILQPSVPEQKGEWREGPIPAFSAGGPHTSFFGGSCFSVAKDSPVADAAVELVKTAILAEQAQVANFKQVGFQPTWKSAYQNPGYLSKADPFLGGQKPGELFASLSENPASPLVQSPNLSAAFTILGGEVVAAYKGQKSAQAAIEDAAAAIEAKI